MAYADTIQIYRSLKPGDRLAVTHDVKIGFRRWTTTTTGTVVGTQRCRHGLHFRRNHDDKVFSDVIVLRRDDGELTSVTLDEFSALRKVAPTSESV